MSAIIKVANLGKRYRVGRREVYRTFRESLIQTSAAPFRAAAAFLNGKPKVTNEDQQIWALQEVSFEVMPGEVMGLVGRNGAGKSTLLKILSRITEPTTGRVELYGRVGSLLEVGTGFHPELTRRENIFLSGAILGMRRAEIARKFDDIVAFAEVDKFVDTPVKRYSSGMYVRLAFAVAAHLEPEILLVDEVLAVGDATFQKRSIGKLGDVAREGRTVLFVSHNMASIEALCRSCLLIRGGCIEAKGNPSEIISRYLSSEYEDSAASRSLVKHTGRRAGLSATMSSIELLSEGEPAGVVKMGSPLTVAVSYASQRAIRPVLGVTFKSAMGAPVFTVSDRFAQRLAFCSHRPMRP
jgi:lipopolysaccharide transport system ATP-binding protein